LVRDQAKDTLLYTGSLKLKITDWFFVKDKITIHYFGLTDTYINTYRSDKIWNYNFLLDALSSSDTTKSSQPSKMELDLKEISIEKLRYNTIDKWRGEDQFIALQSLQLDAQKIDLLKKKIDINSIVIDHPFLQINQYKGLRPKSQVPVSAPRKDGELYWNPY
jgi:hypothetical protein